ncbi:hypothetical protein BU16DRAFT_535011 [Lophium mytilinum]|uniref:Uncharacterized protein n=1 Tax=Lophium mytilinum TaxID=390894 RepID=A0A6A6RA93_9PEZI|nr:hypothetical protein BU16DRAFT_535011 [Lophium mytilinum]
MSSNFRLVEIAGHAALTLSLLSGRLGLERFHSSSGPASGASTPSAPQSGLRVASLTCGSPAPRLPANLPASPASSFFHSLLIARGRHICSPHASPAPHAPSHSSPFPPVENHRLSSTSRQDRPRWDSPWPDFLQPSIHRCTPASTHSIPIPHPRPPQTPRHSFNRPSIPSVPTAIACRLHPPPTIPRRSFCSHLHCLGLPPPSCRQTSCQLLDHRYAHILPTLLRQRTQSWLLIPRVRIPQRGGGGSVGRAFALTTAALTYFPLVRITTCKLFYFQHSMGDASPALRRQSLRMRLFDYVIVANSAKAKMNRFFGRKKEETVEDASVSNVAPSGTKKAKKWKKGQPEPKPELDLSIALPSNDNFRTSLLMPNLSARFSMLREQDDPNSKLGKASDDSVLHPKRQSRLHDFGFVPGGLSDIAETSSINSSIRPPFAYGRQDSIDGYGTDDDSQSGSVMTRSRPGEGNVLFGGRQKVYKIANSGNGSSKSLGRALYEDDVSMSTFQKIRQQERADKEREATELENEERLFDSRQSEPEPEPSSPLKEFYSPSLSGYSGRRGTNSSAGSGQARSSTAATSIASQGANSVPASSPAVPNAPSLPLASDLNRTMTKGRNRLYDQGLDQHIHDQQSSAMSRLNSIQKERGLATGRSTPPFLSQARSANNLSDRFARPGARAGSPTQAGALPTIASGEPVHPPSSNSSPVISQPQSPPMSPLGSDEELNALHSALQPNDRGKATAMGAFNKPKQQFDEQQYAQRLKQMQQGKETPAPTPRNDRPGKPSLRERAEIEARKRAEAGVSDRSRSDSAVKREAPSPLNDDVSERLGSDSNVKKEAPSPFSVFQKAANQMRVAPSPASPQRPAPQPPASEPHTTFFASPGDSSDEDLPKARPVKSSDLDRRLEGLQRPSPVASRTAPPILEHPALRSRNNSRPEKPQLEQRPDERRINDSSRQVDNAAKRTSAGTIVKGDNEIDSPTLGDDNTGLSGLVRQHLRKPSSVSSVYGDDKPPAPEPLSLRTQDGAIRRGHPPSESDTPAHSSYSHSNPWDLEDLDRSSHYGEGDSISSTSPVDPYRPKVQPAYGGSQPANGNLRDRSGSQDTDTPQWEQELRKTHARGGSTETQHEREAFQNELAQRQRAIQERLRNGVSSNDRSRSQSPAASGLKNALGMLRSKTSRDSMAVNNNNPPKPEPTQTKAMRMLGIGASSASASSTSLAGSENKFYGSDHWRSEDSQVGHQGARPKPSRIPQQSEQDARRELEQRLQRGASEDNSRDPRSTKGRSPPASSRSSTRNRSSSELSQGRSRSRTGRYRDDLDKAMAEGTGNANGYPGVSPSIPQHVQGSSSRQHSPETPPEVVAQGRMRSNSRTAAAAYFDQKSLHPIHTAHSPMMGSSPRLSPAANSPAMGVSPGLPLSPRPSPGISPGIASIRPNPLPVAPFSANSTPPISAATTPVASSFSSNIATSRGTMRKKSINKSDISEPVFISATSVMDTVDLPAGASLRNGVESPPPVPPINPRRRFGFGRTGTSESSDGAVQPPRAPFAEPMRTNSADELDQQARPKGHRLRKSSSEGRSLYTKTQAPPVASPAFPPAGLNGSPPRPIADGSMF